MKAVLVALVALLSFQAQAWNHVKNETDLPLGNGFHLWISNIHPPSGNTLTFECLTEGPATLRLRTGGGVTYQAPAVFGEPSINLVVAVHKQGYSTLTEDVLDFWGSKNKDANLVTVIETLNRGTVFRVSTSDGRMFEAAAPYADNIDKAYCRAGFPKNIDPASRKQITPGAK